MKTFLVSVVFLSVGCTVYVAGDCPRPTLLENMELITDQVFPVPEGTTFNLACVIGYRRVGPSSIVCSSGQWTTINMRCQKRNCGSAGEVLNGYVDYSQGTEFGAFATVVCNEGFYAVGSVKVYCLANGWGDRLAECEPILCDPPNSIANGYFSPMKDEYGHNEVINYACNGEYILNGSRTATCENRQFKPAPPTCVLVNCPDPVVKDGVAAGGARPPYKHKSSVTFRCNFGYSMEGRATVSCDINNQWSPVLPKCNQINCTAPNITDGEVEDGPRLIYKFNDKINVKCSKGFKLNGERTLTCGERNQWSPAVPVCTEIQCETPEVAGGVLVRGQRPSYRYSDTVEFECEQGYSLSGTNTVRCGDNEQWSPKLPECTLIQCQTPVVTGAVLVGGPRPSYKYLDTVVFECKRGHNLSGMNNVTCDDNGQWSPKLPQCTPIPCQTPLVEGGVLVGGSRPSYKYSDTVVFECKSGHNLSGKNTLTCDDNGQWSPKLPQCTPIQCETPVVEGGVLVRGSRPSYKYSDTVVFECEPRHNLNEKYTLTCDVNGQWSPKAQCTRVVCNTLVVENAEVRATQTPSKYLDSVVVECKSGYTISGQSTLTCGSNRQWSPEPPMCTRSGSNTNTVVGIVCGVVAVALICIGVYFGIARKKKGDGKSYTEASQEVALS